MNEMNYGIVLEQDALFRKLVLSGHNDSAMDRQGARFRLIEFGGKQVPVGCGQASPIVAILVEVFSRSGVTAVLRIGTCGSLQPGLQEGDVILCTDAVRGEGTSNCYVGPSFPAAADFVLTRRLAEELERHGLTFAAGTIWTTDGRFVETDELVEKYRKHGVLGVDMESSAFFVISKLRGLQAASLSVVSDTPWKDLGNELKGCRVDDIYRECVLPSLERCWRVVHSLVTGHLSQLRESAFR